MLKTKEIKPLDGRMNGYANHKKGAKLGCDGEKKSTYIRLKTTK